jgi:hypothetical protein
MANLNTIRSITQVGKYEPFELQVARGQVTGHSLQNIFGYQAALTTTLYPVWENLSAYTYPASATTMLLYSSSPSDTNVSVLINGLDANFNPISETLVLTNGATGVTTVNSYLRINGMILASGVANVGKLSLSNAGKTVTYAAMSIGLGKSQAAIYTVPAGYTFYLTRVDINAAIAAGGVASVNYQVYSKNNVSGVALTVLETSFTQNFSIRRVVPFAYTEKTDLQWQANADTGTIQIGVNVEVYLIKNFAEGSKG